MGLLGRREAGTLAAASPGAETGCPDAGRPSQPFTTPSGVNRSFARRGGGEDREPAIYHGMRGESQTRVADEVMTTLATAQHGLFARWQLLRAGVPRGVIDRRLERGLLVPVYPGVYAFGHVGRARETRWMAATLCGGPGGVLSHRSAAALWQLVHTPAPIEVTFTRSLRPLHGIARHRTILWSDERTTLHGIPVTTVPRTLFDYAAITPDPLRVERAMHEAEVLRLTDPLSLHDLLDRYPGHRGTRTLRQILATRELGVDVTKEELEHRFLAFLDERALPRPQLNRPLQLGDRTIFPDCMWPDQRVLVELDGRATHDTTRAYESDRLRDRRAQVAGWRTIRVTWRQLRIPAESEELEADLRELLLRKRAGVPA